MQELLLYWLRERVGKKNIQLKKLIATNVYEFFIFDVQEFERVFYSNKRLLRRYEEFNSGSLISEKTNFFYINYRIVIFIIAKMELLLRIPNIRLATLSYISSNERHLTILLYRLIRFSF